MTPGPRGGSLWGMEQVDLARFRTRVDEILEWVRRTGVPVRVVDRGVVIAEIVPPEPLPSEPTWLEGWFEARRMNRALEKAREDRERFGDVFG